jgi:hypothetical protein
MQQELCKVLRSQAMQLYVQLTIALVQLVYYTIFVLHQ